MLLCRELLQQNQALRAKEEQQLKLLGWYDAWSRSVKSELPGHAHVAEPCASTQSDSSSALPAPERLERQSQRLLDSLRPHDPAGLQDTASGPMQPSGSSAQGSGSGSGVAASTAAGSAGSGASATDAQAAAAGGEDHMTRWFSQLDPAELAIYRTMTPEALAGEDTGTTCRTGRQADNVWTGDAPRRADILLQAAWSL